MSAPAQVSIILPTYNEAGNIVRLVRALLDLGLEGTQIIVVDDDSPDGTAAAVSQEFGSEPRVELVVRKADRGLARSIRDGIARATGQTIVVMDTDFNHDPATVRLMVDLLKHVDLVVGSRFVVGGGMEDEVRYYLSWAYNIGVRTLLGTRIQDNLSGFFAIRRGLLERLDSDEIFFGHGDYFFRLLHQATALGATVVEVPVYYRIRPSGQSKTQFLKIFGQYTAALVRFAAAGGVRHRHPGPWGGEGR